MNRDPLFHKKLLDALMNALFTKPKIMMSGQLMTLVTKNSALFNSTHRGFIYKTTYYGEPLRPPVRMAQISPLHASLVPEFQEWQNKRALLCANEDTYVRGYFQAVLLRARTESDFMRLLPDSLHNLLRHFREHFLPESEAMTDEQVIEFGQKNQQYLNMVKQQLALNLLY